MIKAWRAISAQEKLFTAFAMLAGFSIACEYGITRPVSSALFLTRFSAEMLPWVWLVTVPLNFLTIFLYSRWVTRLGPLRLFWIVNGLVTGGNILTALLFPYVPEIIFAQYAWKDIYILLMFKQLWSLIHTSFSSERAKGVYGWIFAMGSVGSLVGSLLPGFLAREVGSASLFLLSAPLYWILGYSFKKCYQASALSRGKGERFEAVEAKSSPWGLIRKSRLLAAALLIVVCMQFSIGLMEYQFSSHLELTILGQDLRTEYYGKVLALTNVISLGLQIAGSYLFLHLFGLKGTHLLIPLILLANASVAYLAPSFAAISIAYVVLKAIDFSLFSISREMLYIPMKLEEKYRAKALIDVFAYRTSKAAVSLLILGMQALLAASFLPFLGGLSIALFAVWAGGVFFLLRRVKFSPA